jgi:hypothetical protein
MYKGDLKSTVVTKIGIGPIISISYDLLYFKATTPKIIPSKALSPGTSAANIFF